MLLALRPNYEYAAAPPTVAPDNSKQYRLIPIGFLITLPGR